MGAGSGVPLSCSPAGLQSWSPAGLTVFKGCGPHAQRFFIMVVVLHNEDLPEEEGGGAYFPEAPLAASSREAPADKETAGPPFVTQAG